MSDRITIKDIAKALNIHHSTVSRALRNDERVKEETRKKINDYAEKNGYQTNMIALELRGEKRNAIAVVVPNINHKFFSNIVSHFTNLASENNYVVSIFQSNENLEREKEIIDIIIQHNFSGVIASISMESIETSHFKKLEKHNIPLVMFDRVSNAINAPKVLTNNNKIMKKMVARLAKKGYKRIVHISGSSELNVFKDRQKGYKAGLTKANLSFEKVISINKDFIYDEGATIAKQLFKLKEKPDAIISDSSKLIYGIIKELKSRKLKIPKDVAIVAFGQDPLYELMKPSITCIVQPEIEIAETTYKKLIDSIKNKVSKSEITVLSSKIVERSST